MRITLPIFYWRRAQSVWCHARSLSPRANRSASGTPPAGQIVICATALLTESVISGLEHVQLDGQARLSPCSKTIGRPLKANSLVIGRNWDKHRRASRWRGRVMRPEFAGGLKRDGWIED
jgi:hypothetical protein